MIDLPSSAFCCRWSDCFPQFLEPEYKALSLTQLAFFFCQLFMHQRAMAKEEIKRLLRAQAIVGMALTNDGSTSCATQSFPKHSHSSLSGSSIGTLRSSIRETCRFKGRCTVENLAAVQVPRVQWKELSCRRAFRSYHHNSRWSRQHSCLRQAPWWGRRMGKSTSFRPPYGRQGCSAVTRNNYGRQSLFTVCKCHWPIVPNHSNQSIILIR